MANTRSAIKRIKQNEKRRQRNRTVLRRARSVVKAARSAIEVPVAGSKAAVLDALRTLDKAVSRGVIHRNTAARRKSALARKLAALPS